MQAQDKTAALVNAGHADMTDERKSADQPSCPGGAAALVDLSLQGTTGERQTAARLHLEDQSTEGVGWGHNHATST